MIFQLLIYTSRSSRVDAKTTKELVAKFVDISLDEEYEK